VLQNNKPLDMDQHKLLILLTGKSVTVNFCQMTEFKIQLKSSLLLYSGKVWRGESLVNLVSFIRQTKTIQISTYDYNLLVKFIHSPNFFLPNEQNEQINLPNFPAIQYLKISMIKVLAR